MCAFGAGHDEVANIIGEGGDLADELLSPAENLVVLTARVRISPETFCSNEI
jgi:hypothetical protein